MLKYILFTAIGVILMNAAICQQKDTTITYIIADRDGGLHKVNTLDEADFYRVITAPDAGDTRVNVKEFYKDGKLKFTGKYYSEYPSTGSAVMSGDCTSYFPNGKKQSFTQCNNGIKDGNEELYYPDGTIYCRMKNVPEN